TLRQSQWPALGRLFVWNSCRGNHLGQRSCASPSTGRTYGLKRSDQNAAKYLARRGPSTYGTGSRTPSGPAVMAPRRQSGHMIAIDPPVRILVSSLASKGPSTHATRPSIATHDAPAGATALNPTGADAPMNASATQAIHTTLTNATA